MVTRTSPSGELPSDGALLPHQRQQDHARRHDDDHLEDGDDKVGQHLAGQQLPLAHRRGQQAAEGALFLFVKDRAGRGLGGEEGKHDGKAGDAEGRGVEILPALRDLVGPLGGQGHQGGGLGPLELALGLDLDPLGGKDLDLLRGVAHHGPHLAQAARPVASPATGQLATPSTTNRTASTSESLAAGPYIRRSVVCVPACTSALKPAGMMSASLIVSSFRSASAWAWS